MNYVTDWHLYSRCSTVCGCCSQWLRVASILYPCICIRCVSFCSGHFGVGLWRPTRRLEVVSSPLECVMVVVVKGHQWDEHWALLTEECCHVITALMCVNVTVILCEAGRVWSKWSRAGVTVAHSHCRSLSSSWTGAQSLLVCQHHLCILGLTCLVIFWNLTLGMHFLLDDDGQKERNKW